MSVNKNRIIELCLVFLISILSFSIGTFVGKKYSDNQHRLALLDPNYKHDINAVTTVATTEEPTVEDPATNVEAKPELTDADVAQLNEEMNEEIEEDPSAYDNSALVKTINPDGTPVAEKKEKPKKESVKAKAKTGAEMVREVASISEKAKSIVQDTKIVDGKMQYTVQVGAYASAADAEKIVNGLQARGYKATQASATVNGKTWYRVQVGLFSSLKDAQVYKKELVEQNRLTSAIIQRVSN